MKQVTNFFDMLFKFALPLSLLFWFVLLIFVRVAIADTLIILPCAYIKTVEVTNPITLEKSSTTVEMEMDTYRATEKAFKKVHSLDNSKAPSVMKGKDCYQLYRFHSAQKIDLDVSKLPVKVLIITGTEKEIDTYIRKNGYAVEAPVVVPK